MTLSHPPVALLYLTGPVPNQHGRTYVLTELHQAVVVGRDAEADIALVDCSGVSRRHFTLVVEGQAVESPDGEPGQTATGLGFVVHRRFYRPVALTDMGSRNGTYVNGQRVTNHLLQDGDGIVFGNACLTFRRITVDSVENQGPPHRCMG